LTETASFALIDGSSANQRNFICDVYLGLFQRLGWGFSQCQRVGLSRLAGELRIEVEHDDPAPFNVLYRLFRKARVSNTTRAGDKKASLDMCLIIRLSWSTSIRKNPTCVAERAAIAFVQFVIDRVRFNAEFTVQSLVWDNVEPNGPVIDDHGNCVSILV
jgi:hypothetical protein